MSVEEKLNTVIHGDVLSVLAQLPNNCVDVTITSPPYNKRNKANGWLVTNETYSHFDDHMPEDEYQAWQVAVLNELFRVTKPGGSVFYNHKLRWENGYLIHPYTWITRSNFLVRQEIVWDRVLAANMRGWRFWQVDERIYWLYKPDGKDTVGKEIESRHAKQSSIWRIKPAARSEDHPAAFPIELPTRALYSMVGTDPKVVLDPFCGTGTTLVAAKLLGHNFIGIDISPEYISLANDRLLNSEVDKERVQVEMDKHVIDDPFVDRKKRGTINWPFKPKPDSGATVAE